MFLYSGQKLKLGVLMKVLIRLLALMFFTQVKAEPLVLVDSMGLLKAPMQTHPEADMLRQILAIYPDKVQVENISRNRANEWLEKSGNACIPYLKKTPEREKHFLFTAPYMAEAALQLIVPANSPWTAKLDLMQRVQPRVSLRELLHLKISPLIGIEINRSYGVEIDKILEENQKHPSLYMRTSSSESVGSLLPMLEKQFIDMVIEYPKIADRSTQRLKYYPLQEAEAISLVYFACSKGKGGETVVNSLNDVLRSLSQQQAYLEIMRTGFPESQRDKAIEYWQQSIKP